MKIVPTAPHTHTANGVYTLKYTHTLNQSQDSKSFPSALSLVLRSNAGRFSPSCQTERPATLTLKHSRHFYSHARLLTSDPAVFVYLGSVLHASTVGKHVNANSLPVSSLALRTSNSTDLKKKPRFLSLVVFFPLISWQEKTLSSCPRVWEEQGGKNSGLVPEPEHLSLIMLHSARHTRRHYSRAVSLWEEWPPPSEAPPYPTLSHLRNKDIQFFLFQTQQKVIRLWFIFFSFSEGVWIWIAFWLRGIFIYSLVFITFTLHQSNRRRLHSDFVGFSLGKH